VGSGNTSGNDPVSVESVGTANTRKLDLATAWDQTGDLICIATTNIIG